jgi:hypothetical protein
MCRHVVASSLLLLGVASLGCEDLGTFETGPGEAFRGQVIGNQRDGGAEFIRQGFAAQTLMELTFDPARASDARRQRSAGTITTYRCRGGATECPRSEREPGHFDSTLDPIDRLGNDALSQYDFPGGGRLRNYMFGSRFRTPGDASERLRDAMVFVSLMENGGIELRVIAQSLIDASGAELYPPLFGVFVLERGRR